LKNAWTTSRQVNFFWVANFNLKFGIKDESGDIEGTISDSVYLGLNTEYFIETGFASKIQVSEESTFEEELQKGNRIRLRINTQKLNIFSADGSQNLIKGVNHGT
ncbi:TOBE domain-containing protein, partial [Streptococcus pneumoniae]|uniref:TOBE domain-containing protein n=1 Tax=Streptococcus pneumoniae TaxID=1313 RepID=UPI0021B64F58